MTGRDGRDTSGEAARLRPPCDETSTIRPPAPTLRKTVRLRTVIGLAFTLILLSSGGGLVWIDHRATLDLLQRQVDQQFDVLASGVTSRVAVQFDSADAVLDTLAMDPPSLDDGERAGVTLARILAELRHTSPAVKSIITAGADGRYILAEHVARHGMDAPTAYHLRIGGGVGSFETVIRLGADFELLSRKGGSTATYDALRRPWYSLATGTPQAVTTPRYLFSGGNRYGFTMSRRSQADPGRVFGIDIRLDSLSKSLKRGLVFAGEHVAIFDRDGSLLGDSGGLALADPLGSASQRQDADGAAFALDHATFQAYRARPEPQNRTLIVDGRAVYANITPFDLNGTTMVVASSVPAHLFEAPATRLLLWSLAIQAAVVAVAAALIAVASRFIAGPIGALASDVEGIIAFDFPGRPRAASRIREIQRLLGAVDMLELTLRAFSTYLPKDVVRGIVDRGEAPALGGSRETVIVMFSDIDGFTRISEALPPDEILPQLTRYFAEISDEIQLSGGTLDKFIGDGVMAFWPLPAAEPDRAAEVCRAVLRACHRIDTLNAAFGAEGRPVLPTRFGLHAGEAMVGSVGTADRLNYTVLGHTVNVASRVEQLNKLYGTRILATATVRTAAGKAIRFRHLGVAEVRGMRGSIEIHELIADAAGLDADRAAAE